MKVILFVGGVPRAEYLKSRPSDDLREAKRDALKFAIAHDYITLPESLVATLEVRDDEGVRSSRPLPEDITTRVRTPGVDSLNRVEYIGAGIKMNSPDVRGDLRASEGGLHGMGACAALTPEKMAGKEPAEP